MVNRRRLTHALGPGQPELGGHGARCGVVGATGGAGGLGVGVAHRIGRGAPLEAEAQRRALEAVVRAVGQRHRHEVVAIRARGDVAEDDLAEPGGRPRVHGGRRVDVGDVEEHQVDGLRQHPAVVAGDVLQRQRADREEPALAAGVSDPHRSADALAGTHRGGVEDRLAFPRVRDPHGAGGRGQRDARVLVAAARRGDGEAERGQGHRQSGEEGGGRAHQNSRSAAPDLGDRCRYRRRGPAQSRAVARRHPRIVLFAGVGHESSRAGDHGVPSVITIALHALDHRGVEDHGVRHVVGAAEVQARGRY